MPYIPHEDRSRAAVEPRTPGELNFAITGLLLDYIASKAYVRVAGLTYTDLNDCLGALAGAQFEFYRRVVVPFENDKMTANGDVY